MQKVLPSNAILIPDNAKQVFEGQIFDVYQWPQKMFDGSDAIFEMLKRPDTVQVIAINDGKLALVNDEQPGRQARVHFPGGRADDEDNSWLDAAKRELLEETGLRFKNWQLIEVFQPVPKAEWFVPWYLATDLENEQAQSLDAGEKIEVIYESFEDVRQRVLSGSESTLSYALPLFSNTKNLNELLSLSEYVGRSTDR